MKRGSGGFTLVEVLAATAVAGVLAAVALPSVQGRLVQSRRIDAVDALMRVQAAEERMRAHHGLYSSDLRALQVAPGSAQGLYDIAVELTGPDRYRATAVPRAGGPQARDRDCAAIVLEIDSGFASHGPDRRCWGR